MNPRNYLVGYYTLNVINQLFNSFAEDCPIALPYENLVDYIDEETQISKVWLKTPDFL